MIEGEGKAADWRAGRLGRVPADAEFIALPAQPAVLTSLVDYP